MRLDKRLKSIAISVAVIAASFLVGITVFNWLATGPANQAPTLAEPPPLAPAARTSFVVAPIIVSLSAIRDAAERSAQKTFAGTASNPVAQVLQNANISWTAVRGPVAAGGGQDMLSLSAPITGKINVTGSLSSKATGAVQDAIGGLLGANAAKQIGGINIKNVNANAEIKGNVSVTSRPKFAANWRIEPNFGALVTLGDTNVSLAGARVNLPQQIKPIIDKTVGEQLNAVAERLRRDPTLENNARAQWARACRSIPLGEGTTSGMPALWLEMKPTRAVAAQPTIDSSVLTLTLGIEAETRISPVPTRPDCPFPDKITIVPPTPGGVSIGVPIDLSFDDVNKIIAAQFVGKTFPEDGTGAVDVTVKRASLAASGQRLLISLLVHAKEKKSFLGLGADATLHIWGKPVLDDTNQTLRFSDVELAVESEAAFGLLGTAARAAVPLLQRTLYEKTVIDLKPFAANARAKIAEAVSGLQKSGDGVRVDAKIDNVRLSDIAFDAGTLRVIAQAEGAINVVVTKIPDL